MTIRVSFWKRVPLSILLLLAAVSLNAQTLLTSWDFASSATPTSFKDARITSTVEGFYAGGSMAYSGILNGVISGSLETTTNNCYTNTPSQCRWNQYLLFGITTNAGVIIKPTRVRLKLNKQFGATNPQYIIHIYNQNNYTTAQGTGPQLTTATTNPATVPSMPSTSTQLDFNFTEYNSGNTFYVFVYGRSLVTSGTFSVDDVEIYGSITCTNPPVFSTPTTTASCSNNGKINLAWTGGVSPYTINYTGAATGSSPSVSTTSTTLTGLATGSYNLTVTDANNCTATTAATVTADNSCRCSDSLQLVSLYNATSGANWTIRDTLGQKSPWQLADPINTWYGVTLNATGCVICLDLDGKANCQEDQSTGNNLNGTLPNAINNLQSLQNLYLANNKLLGNIPDFNISVLKNISLYNNQLSGSIPNFNLPNLTGLNLVKNQLNGNIPNFNLLPKLTFLSLGDNRLSGTIPNFSLPELQWLDISANTMSGAIPNFSFPKLSHLLLGNNQLSSLPNLTLPNVVVIHLYANRLTGTLPSLNLPNLQEIELYSNQLNGAIPVLTLPKAFRLYLHNNQLSGCIPPELKTKCPLLLNTGGNISNNPNLATQSWTNYWNNGVGACLTCTSATASIIGKTTMCGTNPITLTATTNLILPTYAWSTGATTSSITVSTPATYNVTITQSDGCVKTASIVVNADNSCRCSDSLELVSLFNATNGNTWTTKTNWLTSNPIGTWYGIMTNTQGCVTDIHLPQDSLSGTLPNLNIPSLIFLDLGNNQINGTVPNLSLPNLQALILGGNQLNNTIPYFTLPKLQDLFLNNNQFTGSVPNFKQADFPNLRYIDLSFNFLNDTIPNFNLTKLGDLRLNVNRLKGPIPNFNIPPMFYLLLNGNQLTGNIPDFNLPNLQTLNLNDNKLSGSLPTFQNLVKIKQLYLQNNNLSGCYPTEWQKFCRLQFNPNYVYVDSAYNITGNPKLAWQGDFQRFCNNEPQIGASCNDSLATTINDKIQADCACRGTILVDTTTCRYKDSIALIALYDSTDGPNWRKKTNWKSNRPLNEWYGIYTNTEGCVTCIDLDGTMNFTWSMDPDSMGNNLRGQLPTTLGNGNLSKLLVLSLNGNQGLTGTLPSSIGGMTELDAFWANDCRFTTPFPNALWSMPKIDEIDLASNPLNTAPPVSFAQMPKLKSLILDNCGLYGTVPSEWSKFQRLQISWNKLDSMPNLSNISTAPTCSCNDSLFAFQVNRLTFDDIIPTLNNWRQQVPIIYTPQDSIFKDTTITVRIGAPLSIDLKIDGGIPDNVYSWIRNGNPATSNGSSNLNRFIRNVVSLADAGVYTCQVRNTRAPLLTLYSRKITVVVLPALVDSNSCRFKDSVSLVALYNTANGRNWRFKDTTINGVRKKSPWVLREPMENWWGVTLNTQGCVVCLDLDGRIDVACTGDASSGVDSLGSFSLPDAFFNLSELELLYLNGNPVITLPPAIGRLSKLRELQLINCRLTTLPDSVWTLANLQGFVMNGNALNAPFSNKVVGLRNVERLQFNSCGLSGQIPQELKLLNRLRYVDMGINNIDSFPNLSLLPVLSQNAFFDLRNNRLTFDDLLPNKRFWKPTDTLYSPQQKFFVASPLSAAAGSTLTIDLKIDSSLNNSNSYKWFKDGVFVTTTTQNKLVLTNIQPNQAGVYTCEVTNAMVPLLTLYSTNITVNVSCLSTPSVNITATAQAICTGSTTTLTANTNESNLQFQWLKNGVAIANTNQAAYTVNQAGNYAVKVSRINGCETTSAIMTVTVNPLPVPDASNDTAICQNSTARLWIKNNTSNFRSFNWSTTPVATTATVIAAPSVTSKYFVIVTDANGCQGKDSVTVTVNTNPTVVINDTAICSGASVRFQVQTGFSIYLWSSGISTTAINTVMPSQSTTYSILVTDANRCSGTDTARVTVNPVANISLSQTSVACFGQNTGSIALTATSGTPPFSFAWSNGATTQNLTNIAAGNYTVSVTDALGCRPNTQSTTVTQPSAPLSILGTPTLSAISCTGRNDGTINVAVIGGTPNYTFKWSSPNGFSSNSQNVSNLRKGDYSLSITDSKGCATTSAVLTISEPDTLKIGSAIVGNDSCQKAKGHLTIGNITGGNGGNQFSWSNGATGQSLRNLTAGNYTLTVRDSRNCTATSTFSLKNNGATTAATRSVSLCPNESFQLPLSKTVVKTAGFFTDTLKGGNQFGCDSLIPIQITIQKKVDAVDDNEEISQNQSAATIEVLKNDVYPANLVDVNINRKPSFGTVEEKGIGIFKVQVPRAANGILTFTYEICHLSCPNECDTALVKVLIKNANTKELISTAITPNGDGKNDKFDFPEIDWTKYPNNELELFNRWGQRVFYAQPYQRDWEGQGNNGQELPTGDYFFILRLNVAEKIIVGSVYLARS